VAAVLACAFAGGLAWRRGNGRLRSVVGGSRRADGIDGDACLQGQPESGSYLTDEILGQPLGERATLVQFSSAFCAPCRATRRILAEVAGMTDGVAFIEVDAESRLDLVRSLNVLRTPTVLVTNASGLIVKRASGQPRKADVIAAIGQAAGISVPSSSIPSYSLGNKDSDMGSRHA